MLQGKPKSGPLRRVRPRTVREQLFACLGGASGLATFMAMFVNVHQPCLLSSGSFNPLCLEARSALRGFPPLSGNCFRRLLYVFLAAIVRPRLENLPRQGVRRLATCFVSGEGGLRLIRDYSEAVLSDFHEAFQYSCE